MPLRVGVPISLLTLDKLYTSLVDRATTQLLNKFYFDKYSNFY